MTGVLDLKDCRKPWETLYIHLNGDVKPCCYATFPVATLRKPGVKLDEVWHGPLMTEVREAIDKNEIHRICAGAGCAYVRSRFQPPKEEPPPAPKKDSAVDWLKRKFGGSTTTVPSDKQDDFLDVMGSELDDHTRNLAQLGHKRAMYQVALRLQQKGEAARAVELMKKSADLGEIYAQFWLARILLDSNSKFYDLVQGIRYLKEAAEEGYVPALTYLGRCYLHGVGLPVDPVQAVDLFQKAADLGDPAAWRHLAECYRDGKGVAADAKESERLMTIADRREKSAAA